MGRKWAVQQNVSSKKKQIACTICCFGGVFWTRFDRSSGTVRPGTLWGYVREPRQESKGEGREGRGSGAGNKLLAAAFQFARIGGCPAGAGNENGGGVGVGG